MLTITDSTEILREEAIKFVPMQIDRAIDGVGGFIGLPMWISELVSFTLLVAFAYLIFIISKLVVSKVSTRIARSTTSKWDDALVENKVFVTLTYIIPCLFLILTMKYVLSNEELIIILKKALYIFMIYKVLRTVTLFLKSAAQVYQLNEKKKNKPIQVIFQLITVIVYFIGGLIFISILIDKPLGGLIAGIGAFTTIIMLIFKDSILGFVAGWQLSANDQLRIGDWITVPKYGADGDVIEMSLYSVKVRNFDNTITTVPPYALISESFQNWRGMQESKGRRIKRSIFLDLNSVKFCDEKMLEKYSQIEYLKDYITKTQSSFIDNTSDEFKRKSKYIPETARRQTNIGIFRAYMQYYISLNPEISNELTCMVRQLGPSEKGVPLEVYCFTVNKNWVHYEKVQSDIFDHFIAMVPFFDLKIFQFPSTFLK